MMQRLRRQLHMHKAWARAVHAGESHNNNIAAGAPAAGANADGAAEAAPAAEGGEASTTPVQATPVAKPYRLSVWQLTPRLIGAFSLGILLLWAVVPCIGMIAVAVGRTLCAALWLPVYPPLVAVAGLLVVARVLSAAESVILLVLRIVAGTLARLSLSRLARVQGLRGTCLRAATATLLPAGLAMWRIALVAQRATPRNVGSFVRRTSKRRARAALGVVVCGCWLLPTAVGTLVLLIFDRRVITSANDLYWLSFWAKVGHISTAPPSTLPLSLTLPTLHYYVHRTGCGVSPPCACCTRLHSWAS